MSGVRPLGIALVITILAGACAAVTEPVPESVVTMEVAHYRAPCIALMPRECLVVRMSGHTEWGLFYSHIEGFEWEPGFTYKLVVGLQPIADPPQDSSSVEYRLLQLLSKVSVQH